ncbi:ABC transporter permease subunit [Oceanospirillum linum]|uniref:Phosphate ABC transporter permease n=1 Tax=Oceanospirillum linum TaxID=966 RepID=A0A1T1HCJ5_OCELI|nr:ABC transporter permease subunit [Oceanospirillum linum]OOV87437.1 phosphate ABC transporter permease [Oceanospirillum linum]SEF82081.1 phosphate transport system permease protein [Oleiphilus messinensis]SMP19239.1 phosphate transport system permease protein [Oceanospirillum linum]
MKENSPNAPVIDFDTPALRMHRKVRSLKDKIAEIGIGIGGISVIIAILLIFIYLLYEIIPLMKSASVEPVAEYQMPATSVRPDEARTLYLATEEQAEVAMRLTSVGEVVFFSVADGQVVDRVQLNIPAGTELTTVASSGPAKNLLALGLSDGRVLLIKDRYRITYPNDERLITPRIDYPYGEEPLVISEAGSGLSKIAVSETDSSLLISAVSTDKKAYLVQYLKEESLLGDVTIERNSLQLPVIENDIHSMLIGPDQNWIYMVSNKGTVDVVDTRDMDTPKLNARLKITEQNSGIGDVKLQLGGISLLVGDKNGQLSQWFLVRDDQNEWGLKRIRSFEHDGTPVALMLPEHRRKGFLMLDEKGQLSIYSTTAQRTMLTEKVLGAAPVAGAISPRADYLLLERQDGMLQALEVYNKHPEVSWTSLWDKVWYESYEEPAYTWQSSASNNEFEPKYSLMPLAFGTLKAAFYAMIVATPLAICGAIYTAYFMAPALRRKIKPVIELMEALPTVVLGFLAGLFLAPFLENNLPGVFALLILLPIGMVGFGFAWAQMPDKIRHAVPDGWHALLMVPVVLLVSWLALGMSSTLEIALFDGNVRSWLTDEMGIPFDQRNALVVGLAMGFAVIPTIFSITEDAIFAVPKHLSYGSLALGATPWQTLTRVVLPTASPGVFSAVMIGMGRAVGETMIVLMATGNTPIMDVNIFEGMRTLAANIAVEIPESAVGSTHYRILFLAAFVLFMFTFVVNTLAEVIRQRLRKKYGAL